ncbi:hypothetical protein V9T40_011361 [Parthenolecanium corni]|uniref:Uncharacterized protein n=1 Tax=Parthenolecanium corni TaxID=536013 RepID=A0AAN9T5X8_9HEMI
MFPGVENEDSLAHHCVFALSYKQFVQLDEVPITSTTILLQSVASSQATDVVCPPTFISEGSPSDKYPTDFAAFESQKVFAGKAYGYEQSGSGTSETVHINLNLSFYDITIRNGFLAKVYLILMCQLLICTAFIAAFVCNDGLKTYAQNNFALVIIAFFTTIVCLMVMNCFQRAYLRAPRNYISLFVFTIIESFFLAVVSSYFEANEVLLAVGICAVICFALTIFSFQTKINFTFMRGILLIALVILLIFGITLMFWPNPEGARLVYACLGALLFSVYLVYDTQLMIGGEQHEYSIFPEILPEDYVFAALTLYLDIVKPFYMNLMGYGIGLLFLVSQLCNEM